MLVSASRPVVSYRVGKIEGIIYSSLDQQSDEAEHLFLHLESRGEHMTLVLIPSEAMNLRDVLNMLFPLEQVQV